MERFIDRVMTHSAFRAGLLVAVAYTGYIWWRDGVWVWFVVSMVIAISAGHAAERELGLRLFIDPPQEATKPSLWVRFAGHPMIAWPMLFANGFVLFGGVLVGWETPARIDGIYALTFGLFFIIVTMFAQWTIKRCCGFRREAGRHSDQYPATVPI